MRNKVSIFIFIWCQCIAYALLAYEYVVNGGGDNIMDTAGIIALVVALIGVAGGIWAQIVQFKKDRQHIDIVNETSKEIKSDTSRMSPQVENINAKTEVIYSDILRNILPSVSTIEQLSGGMDQLVENLHFEEKMKSKVSTEQPQQDIMNAYISSIYQKNAALNDQIISLELERTELLNTIERVKSENKVLNKENARLKQEMKKFEYSQHDPDMSPGL